MDALTVATSVIAFVDFSSKLLAKSRKIYKSAEGALTENVDIELITSDLLTLSQSLKRQQPPTPTQCGDPLYNIDAFEDKKSLDHICERCVEIAEDLMRRLEKLKVQPDAGKKNESKEMTTEQNNVDSQPATRSNPGRLKHVLLQHNFKLTEIPGWMKFDKWDAFRKALVASWNEEEIEKLVATLREFRDQLEFRMLNSMRTALNDFALQHSNQLAQSTQLIVDTFLNSREDLASQLRLEAKRIIDSQTSEAIDNFPTSNSVGMFQNPKGTTTSKSKGLGHSSGDSQVEQELRLLMIENAILGSLSFTTLTDRQDRLQNPHGGTFEWIYHENGRSTAPWSSFFDWLRHGHGVYWISGRLGSGKSTLMRYIFEHEKTIKALEEWAGPMRPETCGFFFWNSGEEDQKSQCGLLRSLIFQIFQRHRDLIQQIMPDVWSVWRSRVNAYISAKMPQDPILLSPEPTSWTMAQLKRIFRDLLHSLQDKTRLCFFIDGLDEYDGDDYDIISLLQEYSGSPNIKLCLSSRPLVPYEQAFSKFPGMKLHEQTRGDIEHYVRSKLLTHKNMVRHRLHNPKEVDALVGDIVNKANGIFLWIKLVVESLYRGLSDSNRISILKERLNELPDDLYELYSHMLRRTDSIYRPKASRMFQIVRAAQTHSPNKVTLLNLSWAAWAGDSSEMPAEDAPIQPLSHEELSIRCRDMDDELKSVCSGLMESTDVKFSDIAPDSKVLFLHRTVFDWLAKPEVWSEVLSITVGSGFSPNLSMLRSCIMQLKTENSSSTLRLDMNIIHSALVFAKEAEADLNMGFPALMDQLDSVASYQWREASSSRSTTRPLFGASQPEESSRPSEIQFWNEDDDETAIHETPFAAGSGDYDDVFGDIQFAENPQESQHVIGKPKVVDLDGRDEWYSELSGSEDSLPQYFDALESDVATKSWAQRGTVPSSRDEIAVKFAKLRGDHKLDSHLQPEEVLLHHWSYGIEIPGIKPLGEGSTFVNIAKDMGICHYVEFKLESGNVIDQEINQHLLWSALSITSGVWDSYKKTPDPATVDRILHGGTDPNLPWQGITPWQSALAAAVSHFTSPRHVSQPRSGEYSYSQWEKRTEAWAYILETFLRHGADPMVLNEPVRLSSGQALISPLAVVGVHLPPYLVDKVANMKPHPQDRRVKDIEDVVGERVDEQVMAERNSRNRIMSWVVSWF
ncbi:hypothetical protein BKA56DRAFT_281198 [Ilyonectria sp. MPI-CAGE-AT-0026]|nr:hypothetical protein BKA56DRAFT_281198 [Ilyonectria sp. MPI-CAGE-AT-0026]